MGMEDQELSVNINSDITLASGSGANNNESTYDWSRKNMPVIQNTTPDLLAIIKDAQNIIEVYDKGINEITFSRALFIWEDKLDPEEIMRGGETQTETPLDNREMLPILTQPTSRFSLPVDASDSPLMGPHKDVSNTACL